MRTRKKKGAVKTVLENAVITNIYSVNLTDFKSTVTKRRIYRERCGLIFKTEGKTVYNFNGKTFRSGEGKCLFLPKNIEYEFSVLETGACYTVDFDIDVFPGTEPTEIEPAAMSDIIRHIIPLYRLWNAKVPAYHSRCMSELYRIIAYLTAESGEYRYKSKSDKISAAVAYMNEHFLDPSISNAVIAEAAGISEVYFRKIFTAVYGVSPQKHITDQRIKYAKELLKGDYTTVEDVALSSGYTSVFHFCKSFKAATGKTPTEYSRG